MGEIIRVNFQTGERGNAKLEGNSLESLIALAEKIKDGAFDEKINEAIHVLKKLKRMKEFLSKVRRGANRNTSPLPEDLTAGMNLEAMCNEIISSEEMDWTTRPEHFRSIVKKLTNEKLTNMLLVAMGPISAEVAKSRIASLE